MAQATEAKDPVCTIEGYIHVQTAKAILFEAHTIGGENIPDPKKEWIPFSQTKRIINAPTDSEQYDSLVISNWIARQKGYI